MKSLVRALFIATVAIPLAQSQSCDYAGITDVYKNDEANCYSGNFKPWPITDATPGMCLADVGIGGRSCEQRAYGVCDDFVELACLAECIFFHSKCCCSPLYPTPGPTKTPTTSKPTKAPVSSPVKLTPRPTVKKVATAPAPAAPVPTAPVIVVPNPTRVPTASPTQTAEPSINPTISYEPSKAPIEVTNAPSLSKVPTIKPTLLIIPAPPVPRPTNMPTTGAPTAKPFYQCPWETFTGYKADCVNYDLKIEGDYCYFSAERESRIQEITGKFQGEKNPFKLCTIEALDKCDASDWWSHGPHCNSLCVNFHSVCCCHLADNVPS